VRADAVFSFFRIRECRNCSQAFRPPPPVWLCVTIILVGLGMMAWLAARLATVGFDRYDLLNVRQLGAIGLAGLGALVALVGLFKWVFQRGVKPPEKQDWRVRAEPLPPAMPAGRSVVAVPLPIQTAAPIYASALPASPAIAPAAAHRPAPPPTVSAAGTIHAAAVAVAPAAMAAAPVVTQVRPIVATGSGPMPSGPVLAALRRGVVIPAHPLALTSRREFDERRMRAITRYYLAAGAGGVAVGVHATQFAIRKPKHQLLKPVLEVVSQELHHHERITGKALVKVAGICGTTRQAMAETELAAGLGYDMGLLDLSALPPDATEFDLIDHCKRIARTFPIFGFYLQPAVGGRVLSYSFWRAFAEIPNVVAIKVAPFNRYRTIDVLRGVADAGRALASGAGNEPIAVYTGNDDSIMPDLLGEWMYSVNGKPVTQRIVGGLLGHWSVWTKAAVETFENIRKINESGVIPVEAALLSRQVTDMNAAVFDAANNFKGCIAGVHEVLRRQGLLEGAWCLDPAETLSPGQADEITRVTQAYPHLTDDAFVAAHRDEWMR
jgi:dihydrodipicolinate synthase/N-acetylneuraminate lyase